MAMIDRTAINLGEAVSTCRVRSQEVSPVNPGTGPEKITNQFAACAERDFRIACRLVLHYLLHSMSTHASKRLVCLLRFIRDNLVTRALLIHFRIFGHLRISSVFGHERSSSIFGYPLGTVGCAVPTDYACR